MSETTEYNQTNLTKLKTAAEYAYSSLRSDNYGGEWLAVAADDGETSGEILLKAKEKYAAMHTGFETLAGETKEGEQLKPRVSVVIPVYSGEDPKSALTLIGSLLDNTDTPPTEIITVINGPESTGELEDNKTAKVLKEIGIKVVCRQNRGKDKNQNIFGARQAGLDATEGNQVLNVDADTVVSPVWIKNLSHQLESTPFAYGPMQMKRVTELVVEKPLIAVSIISKAGKIALGMPPYQGGSHAFDKDKVLAIYEKPYELIEKNEQELPRRLSELAGNELQVGYVNEAGVITPFGHAEGHDSSWNLVRSYFRDTVSRNLRHFAEKRKIDTKIRSNESPA